MSRAKAKRYSSAKYSHYTHITNDYLRARPFLPYIVSECSLIASLRTNRSRYVMFQISSALKFAHTHRVDTSLIKALDSDSMLSKFGQQFSIDSDFTVKIVNFDFESFSISF